MQDIADHWLAFLVTLVIGFVLGRLTAKSPIERDRARKAYEAGLRGHKSRLQPDTVSAVNALLREGKRIEAIKRVRVDLGIGLKEAKDLVEGWPGRLK